MTSVLILSSNGPDAPPLEDDLEASGFEVVAYADGSDFLETAIRIAPNLVICFERAPGTAFFESMATLGSTAPRPVVVFTNDPDAEKIALATRSAIHAYVVNGYTVNRLRSVVHLAQARFRHDQLLRQELADVTQRFAERKLVDRAKGILMGARQLREEEAFRALRAAAMATKQRIGQVAQIVIDQARYAEAMNRAGQLRMLSQRLVKLYALACTGTLPTETKGLFADSLAHVDNNLAILARSLSEATFGDLLSAVTTPWADLRTGLQSPPQIGRLRDIDDLAEKVLRRAEQLSANLEIAAFATALRVINVSGRQRMLSQRLAKEALMASLLDGRAAAAAQESGRATRDELLQGMAYLTAVPLSNADIRRELDGAARVWAAFDAALAQDMTAGGRARVAELSETLLGHFDRLTDQFERGMQTLVG